ncbi:hypothetical protein GCM10022200_18250 [Microbacterium awajiense]|uniref:Lipoprotein n=1 Tax=Microbacterium awajiense TaxID=415214 RepID=A0ABP7AL39_9MICO
MRLRTLAAAAAASALLLLAGCATSPGGGDATTGPSPSDDPAAAELAAAWLDSGRAVGLVTWGSSTCQPTAIVEPEGQTLRVELVDDAQAACTRDYVPRATVLGVPEDVDATENLEIIVTGDAYSGRVELDGLDPEYVVEGMTDYEPSAGWTDIDGMFVILTWGSSGCPPVLEDVTETAEAEITATFADPPADQVCTADMAPRGTVAYVDALSEDSDVELVLVGDGYDSVRVPILPD